MKKVGAIAPTYIGWLHSQCGFSLFRLPVEWSFLKEIFRIFACKVKFLGFFMSVKKIFIFGRDFLKLKKIENKNVQKIIFHIWGFFLFFFFFFRFRRFPGKFCEANLFSVFEKKFGNVKFSRVELFVSENFSSRIFYGPFRVFSHTKRVIKSVFWIF